MAFSNVLADRDCTRMQSTTYDTCGSVPSGKREWSLIFDGWMNEWMNKKNIQMAARIPKKDDLMGLDRNPENFEVRMSKWVVVTWIHQGFLESPAVPTSEILTVAHVRRFVPCTSNLDPYLRKQIRGIIGISFRNHVHFLCVLISKDEVQIR